MSKTNLKVESKLDFGRRPFKSVAEVQKAIDMWLNLKQSINASKSGVKLYDADGKNINQFGGPESHGFTIEMINTNLQACYLVLQGMLNTTLDLYAPSSRNLSTAAGNQDKSPARINKKEDDKVIQHPAAKKAEETNKAQEADQKDHKKFTLDSMMKSEFTMESLAQLVYDVAREGTAQEKRRVEKAVPILLYKEHKKNITDRPKRFEKLEAIEWYNNHFKAASEALQKEINLDNPQEGQKEAQKSTSTPSEGNNTKEEQKSENEPKNSQKQGSMDYDPAKAREMEVTAFSRAIATHLKENDGYITKKAFYVELVPGGHSVSAFLSNNSLNSSKKDNKFIEDIAKSVGLEYKGIKENKIEKPEVTAEDIKDAEIVEEYVQGEETQPNKFNFDWVFNNKLLKFLQLGSKSKAGQALRQEMSKYNEFKTNKGKLDKHKAKVLTQEAFKRYDEIEKAKKEGKTADFNEEKAKIDAQEPALQEIKDMNAEEFTQHLIDLISKGETKDALEDAKFYFTPQGWDDEQILAELQKYGYPKAKSEEKKSNVDNKDWLNWDEHKFRAYYYEGTKRSMFTPAELKELEEQAVEYLKTKNPEISNDDVDKWIKAAHYKGKSTEKVNAETDIKDEEKDDTEQTEEAVKATTEIPEKYQGLKNISLSKSAFKKLIKDFLREEKDLKAAYELAKPWYNKHYTDKSDKAFYQWINTYAEAVGIDTKKSKTES